MMKIDRRKHYFIVLDTETQVKIKNPLPFEIGYCVCDSKGRIYLKRSFLIKDTFERTKWIHGFMYAGYDYYLSLLAEKKIEYLDLPNIRKIILQDCEDYRITKIYAYNATFDRGALNRLWHTLYDDNEESTFLPENLEWCCIYHMACQSLLNRPSYFKFVFQNNQFTEKGNVKTGAESCYRYLTNNPGFEEKHTALEDAIIEVAILAKIKSMKGNKDLIEIPYNASWRRVTWNFYVWAYKVFYGMDLVGKEVY